MIELANGFKYMGVKEWSKYGDRPTPKMKIPVMRVFDHHTVTNLQRDYSTSSATTEEVKADFRAVESALISRGLDGYSFLAHPSGVIGEFNGLERGEHTGGYNSTSISIALVGNYDVLHPTIPQIVNMARLVNFTQKVGGLVKPTNIQPHSAVKATACPGFNTMNDKWLNGNSPHFYFVHWSNNTAP